MKLVILFLIISLHVAGQEMAPKIENSRTLSNNEISYEFLIAPGYAHIWTIKDKLRLGTGFHFGFAYDPLIGYSDFFMMKVFTRDVFRSKSKFTKPEKFDLGISSSVSFQNEVLFYGLLASYYINFHKRWKVGINGHFGQFLSDDSNPVGLYFTTGIYFKFYRKENEQLKF